MRNKEGDLLVRINKGRTRRNTANKLRRNLWSNYYVSDPSEAEPIKGHDRFAHYITSAKDAHYEEDEYIYITPKTTAVRDIKKRVERHMQSHPYWGSDPAEVNITADGDHVSVRITGGPHDTLPATKRRLAHFVLRQFGLSRSPLNLNFVLPDTFKTSSKSTMTEM